MISRNQLYALAILVGGLLLLASQTFYVIKQTEQAVVVQAPGLGLGRVDLDYLALAAGLKKDSAYATFGLERMDGDGVRGFGTPLATLHAYQGWADVFLATPARGVRDINLRAGATVPLGSKKLKLAVAAHDFTDADGGLDYGSEFDASASLPLTPQLSLEVKAARFEGDTPAFADRSKIWVTLELKL